MTISKPLTGGEQASLSKEQIIAHIKEQVSRIWNAVPLNDEITSKIESGTPLTEFEANIFILNENRNIRALRDHLPGIISRLSETEPKLLEKLVGGEHVQREYAKSGGITKFLLALDEKEQFFIDLFFFAPKAITAKHDHNAHCISYQLEGNLREVVYRQLTDNHQLVESKLKPAGHSTIVSPHGDHDDIHAITNDTNKPAATIHVYAQRVLGKDNIIRINRSDAPTGPTSVVRVLSGQNNSAIIPWQEKTQRPGLASYITSLTERSTSLLERVFLHQTAGSALSA